MPNDALPVGYIQLKMLHNLVVIIAGSARFRYVPLAPAAARWNHAHRRPTSMNDKDVEEALRIVRTWPWERSDFDFSGIDERIKIWRPLSGVVNSLAMEGIGDAAAAVLRLLASGRVEAKGKHCWRACRRSQNYEHDGEGAIAPVWWRKLEEASLSKMHRSVVETHLLFGEKRDCPRRDWAWSNDSFVLSSVTEGVNLLDPDYEEEWFSADEIAVSYEHSGEVVSLTEVASATASNAPPVERNRGGAPQKYNWELAVAVVVHKWGVDGCWHPKSQADVVEKLAEHFAEKGQYPQSSQLKSRGRLIFEVINGGEVATNSPIPSGPITQDQRGSTPF